MSSRITARRIRYPVGCQRPGDGEKFVTLDAIARAYKGRFRPRSQQELDKRAGFAQRPDGKRYDHQRRIPRDVLQLSADRLGRAKLERARDFDDLHQIVNNAIGSIPGIGRLTVYDTALRIGANLSLAPDRVYLHAGTRTGARKLGLNWRADSLAMSEVPGTLRDLEPREVEDCLCIFDDRFTTVRNRPSNKDLQPTAASVIVRRRG